MINSINELYNEQKKIWNEENEFYFGVSSLSNWGDPTKVKEHLSECASKFWNNGSNEMKVILENGRCRDIDKIIPGSYELLFDHNYGVICLYAKFQYKILDKLTGEEADKIKRSPLAYLPYANDLCWFLGDTEYVLRITASVNYSLITKTNGICKYQKSWTYDSIDKKFIIKHEDFDPFEKLTECNKTFLKACYGQEITKENFENALISMPESDTRSIIYFTFDHLGEMFNMVKKSNRFANPLMKIPVPINVVKMFTSQKNREDAQDNGSSNNLVMTTNHLFSLENSRTIIYKNTFSRSFNFIDSEKLFDAFKTSTNKSAGRSRLILDGVKVKNGMLWNRINGQYINMYELILNDHIMDDNLSVISCSMFSSNNDPKRIMMTAKLRAQAINTVGEIDPFTHETPARIVFGDFEGFNYGDSIIISKSFAKKLQSTYIQKRRISRLSDYTMLNEKYQIGDTITIEEFTRIVGSSMCDNYRNIKLIGLSQNYITIEAQVPFSVGDKITNLHGSKGIVSLIFEDEDMPILKNDIGENFKAGPFDVVVSALSVYRRKSLGQLFEAWALATGHNNVNNIQDAVKLYSKEMEEFSEQTIVSWKGHECIKPCGINMMIRLDHNAVAKQSKSYIKSNYARMLKFGEMELLNLGARGLFDIMNEIDIRSVSKHYDSLSIIKKMQQTGETVLEMSNNLRFFNILNTIGFDFNLRNNKQIQDSKHEFLELQTILTDNEIDLFKEGGEGNAS